MKITARQNRMMEMCMCTGMMMAMCAGFAMPILNSSSPNLCQER